MAPQRSLFRGDPENPRCRLPLFRPRRREANYHFAVAAIGLRLMQDRRFVAHRPREDHRERLWATKGLAGEN